MERHGQQSSRWLWIEKRGQRTSGATWTAIIKVALDQEERTKFVSTKHQGWKGYFDDNDEETCEETKVEASIIDTVHLRVHFFTEPKEKMFTNAF